MKYIKCLFLPILISGCTSAQISQAIGILSQGNTGVPGLSTEQVVAGLKEALTKGISKGTNTVSALDGYNKNPNIKIPFPPEIQQVETRVRQIGLGSQVDKFVLTLNRGAEDAAKSALPIFVSSIKQMTIDDAWGILKGDDTAATEYLKKTTTAQLTQKFQPVIHDSLNKVHATKYYSSIITKYNQIPFVEDVNPNLDEYATEKAIDGLFYMIGNEEKLIRKDPLARTTDILKKVFAQQ